MRNAKKELLEHIGNRDVTFIRIAYRKNYTDIVRINGCLNPSLPLLDFDYDSGFGTQELFGFIWYADGTWSYRSEYDGAEGWEHQERPDESVEIDFSGW